MFTFYIQPMFTASTADSPCSERPFTHYPHEALSLM